MPLRLPGGVNPLQFRSTYYVESDEYPQASYYYDRGQITSRIQVDHAARQQAVDDFLGEVEVLTAGSGVNYISRTIPHAWPQRPWMYCQAVTQETPLGLLGAQDTIGNGTGQSVYDLCELTLNYVMPTWRTREDAQVHNDVALLPDGVTPNPWAGVPDEGRALERGYNTYSRYVTRVQKHATKTFVFNRGILADSSGNPILEGVPFPDPGGEVQYTWHQVPEEYLPQAVWISNGNSVNNATFDNYPAGTLLFDGNVEVRTTPNPIKGQYLADVTYRFKLSLKTDPADDAIYGHKHIWKVKTYTRSMVPKTGLRPDQWTVKTIGGNSPEHPIREYDFKNFFRPRQPTP